MDIFGAFVNKLLYKNFNTIFMGKTKKKCQKNQFFFLYSKKFLKYFRNQYS